MGLVKRFLKPMGRGLTKDDAPEPVKRAIVQLEDHAQDLANRATAVEQGHRLIGQQAFTANGYYQPTSGTTMVVVRASGGGGGGGGAGGLAGNTAGGGGGGSGAFIEAVLTGNPITGGAVVIGAGGAAGASTGANGGDGGDTTVTINGTVITATRGQGGGGMGPQGGNVAVAGGSFFSGYYSGTGWRYVAGERGAPGIVTTVSAACWGGNGGSNPVGVGGFGPVRFGGTGGSASGFGAGGAGGLAGTVGQAGGLGAAGIILIDEYK